MPLFLTAHYKVKPESVDKVKLAIEEFTNYVKENEPGTRLYLAWQQADDPTHFLHFFIFADEAAQKIHSQSAAVKKFESIYSPELVEGAVVFTKYLSIASKFLTTK